MNRKAQAGVSLNSVSVFFNVAKHFRCQLHLEIRLLQQYKKNCFPTFLAVNTHHRERFFFQHSENDHPCMD